jgi:predicted O-linked N-acetylglucosamine transferase (SPINDLY family)
MTPDTAQPLTPEQALQQAVMLHQAGRLNDAERLYRAVLLTHPRHPDAHHNLGILAMQLNRPDAGLFHFGEALNALFAARRYAGVVALAEELTQRHPGWGHGWKALGTALAQMGRYSDALPHQKKSVALLPADAEAHFNLGNNLLKLERLEEAEAAYQCALQLKPGYAEAYCNMGTVLRKSQRPEEACTAYRQAIRFKPDYAEACNNLGATLCDLGRTGEADACFQQALAIRPDFADAYCNRGHLQDSLRLYDAALQNFDQAIALRPNFAEAHCGRGDLLRKAQQYEAAIESFARALAIKPDYDFLTGTYLNGRMQLCDWTEYDAQAEKLAAAILRGAKVIPPFPLMAIVDAPELHRRAAEIWGQNLVLQQQALPALPPRAPKEKIRIGYFSADFHNHATTSLMAELFELHDKARFELVAFSFGPEQDDAMRARTRAAFDRFIDVQAMSNREVAQLARELEIDIAVDLKGYTQDSRPGIFGFRAAPVQVNYLGYPGTMAADCMDYLIADSVVIPEHSRQYYPEKIITLPNSYQPNDRKRDIAARQFTRAELGLPEDGFVFCCFNNNFKITPDVFADWMRILGQTPGSVLWLLQSSPAVCVNLRLAAAKYGIAPERLIFAPRLDLPEHLARHRLADLFLDTFPYNAHTTASDALWTGLPVLTRAGASFASRVAASLLTAIGLPELITRSREDYVKLAATLAAQPKKLMRLKKELEKNRNTHPLFDAALFARHIEEAYTRIWQRYSQSLPPEDIDLRQG